MAEVTISFPGEKFESIKVKRFSDKLKPQMRKALKNAGVLMERELKIKLKPSNTGLIGKSPHTELRSRTGMLRSSIGHKMGTGAGGDNVKIGPHLFYGAVHEFGGRIPVTARMRKKSLFQVAPGQFRRFAKTTSHIRIPPRPWFSPTVKKERGKIVQTFRQAIYKPLR